MAPTTTQSSPLFLSGEPDPKFQSHFRDLLQPSPLSSKQKYSDGHIQPVSEIPEPSSSLRKNRPLIEIVDEHDGDDTKKEHPKQKSVDQEEGSHQEGQPNREVISLNPKNEDDGDDDEDPPPLFFGANPESNPPQSTTHSSGSSRSQEKASKNMLSQREKEEAKEVTMMEQMMEEATIARKHEKQQNEAKERKEARTASFGMKKGFLNNSSAKKTKKRPIQQKAMRSSEKSSSSSSSSFGKGLKKGFLDSSTKSKEKSSNETVTIRRSKHPDVDPLVLGEVQEAMKNQQQSSFGFGNADWSNPEFMQRIASNPRLVAGMQNPKFTSALQALQENPRKAMEKFSKGNHPPEVLDFLREFCGVIGEHFTMLGERQDKKESPQNAKQTNKTNLGPLAEEAMKKRAARQANGNQSWDEQWTREDRERVDSIVGNEKLSQLLMDPDMQRVIQECQNPQRLQEFMKHPDYRPKLIQLIRAGLLQFEH